MVTACYEDKIDPFTIQSHFQPNITMNDFGDDQISESVPKDVVLDFEDDGNIRVIFTTTEKLELLAVLEYLVTAHVLHEHSLNRILMIQRKGT